MSLQPDQGMSAIAADMARRGQAAAAEAARAAPPGGGGSGGAAGAGAGAELEVFARLAVALDANTSRMAAAIAAGAVPWEVCHPIPLNPITNTAAGSVSDERWEPREGFAWHITRVSVQSNANGGATSALVVADSVISSGAYNLQSFPPPGTAGAAGSFLGCWEPKGLFLMPGNRLILQTSGGGAIANGQAIEIATDWLSRYLL
jgi:hypothetical protein